MFPQTDRATALCSPQQVLEDLQQRVALLRSRPDSLDEFMAYLVAHTKQVEEKKAVLAASVQV